MGGRVVGLMGFPNSPRLHGRDRECAVLDDLLTQVRGRPGGVLLLRGEPGIGKTALLGHLVEAGSGLRLARCTGVAGWPT
jgi:hypothetical protein